MEYEKCPTCGNKQLIVDVEDVIRTEYSATTGKIIKKKGCIHTNCWMYKCRCGWVGEPTKWYESLPDVIRAKYNNI